MSNLAQEKKYKNIITALSVVIPLAVAGLFLVNLKELGFDVEPLSFLPPIYASINAITAILLIAAVVAIKNGNKKLHEQLNTIAIGCSLVFLLLYIVYKYFRENTNSLNFAIASALFIILEAIIGAIIVIFQWVAEDASIARAIIVPFHLINTFFLMFFLVGVPWSLKQEDKLTLNWKSLFANKYWKQFFIGIFFFFLLSISGATSALADSLFSLGDLKSELIADFSSRSHLLTRLRILHPIIAIITAGYLVFYAR